MRSRTEVGRAAVGSAGRMLPRSGDSSAPCPVQRPETAWSAPRQSWQPPGAPWTSLICTEHPPEAKSTFFHGRACGALFFFLPSIGARYVFELLTNDCSDALDIEAKDGFRLLPCTYRFARLVLENLVQRGLSSCEDLSSRNAFRSSFKLLSRLQRTTNS